MLTRIVYISIFSLICCSCYRLPTEEDYSLIPMTNNPDYITGGSRQPSDIGF